MNIIREEGDCPIKPEHIDNSGHFWNSVWGNDETEISARWLTKFALNRGSWAPFRLEQLEDFYHKSRPETERFCFNKLTTDNGTNYIVEEFEYLHFTTEFVAACYAVSPAT